jgi:putative spermidine/putrescine transport system ATP-binding protein
MSEGRGPRDNHLEYTVYLKNLSKSFKDTRAVDEVTLGVRKGEFVTLLGPSGSGKTTILMMIAGFQIPTSGEIYIEGEMVLEKPAFKRNIGMVFQNYALFPHMTVFDNVAFPLRMRKEKNNKVSEYVDKVLELVKLTGLGSRYPKQLSGGQQQRVALSRALVYNPPVLLMDEPLGALDKKLREHMQLEIVHLQKSLGITVIYVTHDQHEALTMSDRVAILNHGRIEQLASANDIYERPKNKFVADFIGETNIMTARIVSEKDNMCQLLTDTGVSISTSERLSRSKKELNVLIRPERISFVESHDEMLNTYDAIVEEEIYLGDTYKYKVSIGNNESLILSRKNDFTLTRYSVGSRVIIGWHDEDMNVV